MCLIVRELGGVVDVVCLVVVLRLVVMVVTLVLLLCVENLL